MSKLLHNWAAFWRSLFSTTYDNVSEPEAEPYVLTGQDKTLLAMHYYVVLAQTIAMPQFLNAAQDEAYIKQMQLFEKMSDRVRAGLADEVYPLDAPYAGVNVTTTTLEIMRLYEDAKEYLKDDAKRQREVFR